MATQADDEAEIVKEYRKKHFSVGDIPDLYLKLQSADPVVHLCAVIGFRKMLSEETGGPIYQVFDSGSVPFLIAAAKRVDYPKLQLEALWALTNLASGTSEAVMKLLEMGIVGICIDALEQGREVQEQALWAIGNLAGDSPNSRDLVLQQNGCQALSKVLFESPTTNITFWRNGIWALSNLCRGRPLPAFKYCSSAINPMIAAIRHFTDTEMLTDALWALSYLSDGDSNRLEIFVRSGTVPTLITFLNRPTLSILVPTIRTLGNIATGDAFHTQAVIDAGFIEASSPLLTHTKRSVRREVLWTLSNITAGEPEQIAQFTQSTSILGQILSVARNDSIEVVREAIWVLSNALAHCNEESRKVLLSMGVIEVFKVNLGSSSEKIIYLILEALKNLFQSCVRSDPSITDPIFMEEEDRKKYHKMQDVIKGLGHDGLQQLEQLQYHPDNQVYSKASEVILTHLQFIEGDESEDPSLEILRDLRQRLP